MQVKRDHQATKESLSAGRRGPSVTQAQRRHMAEDYLRGLKPKDIASNVGVTQQTVNRHLPRALDELSLETVQRERLVKAVTNHETQLMEFLGSLRSIVVNPNPEVYAVGTVAFPPDCLQSTRERLLYSALQEHTKESELWNKLQLLRVSAARFEHLNSEVRGLLEVSAQDLKRDQSQPSFEPDRLAGYLSLGVRKIASGSLARDALEAFVEGGKHLFPSSDLDDARATATLLSPEVFRVLDGTTGIQLKSCWDEVGRLCGAIEEDVERIQLRQILPGQCELCPRLSFRPSSTRRRTAVQRSRPDYSKGSARPDEARHLAG